MIYTISYIMAAKTHCGGRSELRRCAFLSTGNWPRMSWRGEEGAGDTVEGRRDGGERKVRVEWRGIEGRQQQEAMVKRDCGDEAVTRRAGRENEMWVWTFCHAMRVRDWTVLFIVRWEEKELPFAFFVGKATVCCEKNITYLFIQWKITHTLASHFWRIITKWVPY